jgi:DNA-binding LytR/AlgR family response regulator
MEPKGKGDYWLLMQSGKKVSASRSYMKYFTENFQDIG